MRKKLRVAHQLIFLIPGDEYVSSCLWPLRSRCSIVEKSFLFTSSCLRNSDLEASVLSFKKCKSELLGYRGQLTVQKRGSWLSCPIQVRQKSLYDNCSNAARTSGFFRTSLRHLRYNERTSRCRPDNRRILVGKQCLARLFVSLLL